MGCRCRASCRTRDSTITDFGDNATVLVDAENTVLPDAMLRLQRGRSLVDADGYSEGGAYASLQPGADGVIRSRVYSGLWLAVPAMLAEDLATVLAVLQQGIASDDHGRFVARLRSHMA
jgi:hypothetical protein